MAYLTKLQREVAERLERGATMSELLEEGVVSPLTVRKWDVDDVVRRYRLEKAPPPEEVELELRAMAGHALRTLRYCMAEGNPQTRLLAARYVLDAIRAPASEEGPGDEAVAELRVGRAAGGARA
mgnify:CR=1 FL=1